MRSTSAKHYREAVTAKRLRAQRAIFFGFTDRLIINIYLPMVTYFLYITCHGGRFAVPLTAAASRYVLRTFFTRSRTTSSGLPITPHFIHAIERSELPAKQAAWRQHANQLAPTQTDTIVQRVLWVPELQGCYSLLIHFSEYSGEIYPKCTIHFGYSRAAAQQDSS